MPLTDWNKHKNNTAALAQIALAAVLFFIDCVAADSC